MMKAVATYTVVEGDKYEKVLKEIEIEKPTAKGRDVLIAVKAFATNPVDTKVLGGKIGGIAENTAMIVGWDGAGVIEAIGEEVKNFKEGDEVYFAGSIIRQGAFAEYVLVDERIIALKPKNLTFSEAASLPLTTITAWESFVKLLHIRIPKTEEEREENAKKVVLIVGAAGGVGTIAVQIAKRILNLTVIATASRDDTIDWVKKHGADFVINHHLSLFPQLSQLGFSGVDFILSCTDISSRYYKEFIDCALPLASICYITAQHDDLLNLAALMPKSLTLTCEFMFARPMHGVDLDFQHLLLSQAAEYVEKKILTHTKNYEFSYSLDNVVKALQLQLSGRAIGKIVISRE